MNDLTFTVSLQGVLVMILLVLAIVAVVFLIKVLKNVGAMTDQLNTILQKNNEELDLALKSVPVLTDKLESSLTQVNQILNQSSDDIVTSLSEVKNTLVQTTRISSDIADTVEYVATSAVDAADAIAGGVNRGNSTLSYMREIAHIVRDVIRK